MVVVKIVRMMAVVLLHRKQRRFIRSQRWGVVTPRSGHGGAGSLGRRVIVLGRDDSFLFTLFKQDRQVGNQRLDSVLVGAERRKDVVAGFFSLEDLLGMTLDLDERSVVGDGEGVREVVRRTDRNDPRNKEVRVSV